MWRRSFEHGVGITDPHPLEEQEAYLLNEVVPSNSVVVAMRKDELVGFCAASSEAIAQLYVDVDHQRKGIGTRLLSWAQQQSTGSLWLYTFKRNANARAFYERQGFYIVEHGFEEMWQLEDLKYRWERPA